MIDEQKKLVEPVLNTITNDDIREFATALVDDLPKYIWEVGASSTGKYHPEYSLGHGGLMRHQVAVVRFLNFFFELEQYNSTLTDRQMDLMRVAALVHDGRKSGDQEDFEKSKFTRFDHPIRMANVVRNMEGLNNSDKDFIAHCIESHMGQWNVDKKTKVELPKPSDVYQNFVHLADYLASRKDLTVSFDNFEAPKRQEIDLDTYELSFGKHKGRKLIDVYNSEPDYISWLDENISRRDVKEAIAALKKKIEEDDDL